METQNVESNKESLLANASTDELRALVRAKVSRHNTPKISPTAIVGMRKSECVEYLTNDIVPNEQDAQAGDMARMNAKNMARMGNNQNAASLLKQAIEALGIEGKSEATIDEAKLKALIAEEVARSVKPMVTHLEIKTGDEVKTIKDCQHRLFPIIMALLSIQDLNICLTGPAGSGKTACLCHAAKALGINVYLSPMNIMTTKSDLGGYMDATGKYVESSFYKAFKNGGLYIADEFDCCNAGMATWLNAAIANRMMTFPNNETVAAHKDFRYCACMNTTGQGATIQYVGRNALDAATLDRFVLVDFQYDDALELNICGIKTPQDYEKLNRGGLCTSPGELVDFIRALRRNIAANKYKATLSPRASITACKMMQAGIGMYWIFECVVLKGLTTEQKSSLMRGYLERNIGGIKASQVK